jgi:hypothetical protein
VLAMGRFAALFIFSAIGFTIGFLGYLASPTVYNWLSNAVPNVVLNQVFIGAIATGVAGSIASATLINRWSKRP